MSHSSTPTLALTDSFDRISSLSGANSTSSPQPRPIDGENTSNRRTAASASSEANNSPAAPSLGGWSSLGSEAAAADILNAAEDNTRSNSPAKAVKESTSSGSGGMPRTGSSPSHRSQGGRTDNLSRISSWWDAFDDIDVTQRGDGDEEEGGDPANTVKALLPDFCLPLTQHASQQHRQNLNLRRQRTASDGMAASEGDFELMDDLARHGTPRAFEVEWTPTPSNGVGGAAGSRSQILTARSTWTQLSSGTTPGRNSRNSTTFSNLPQRSDSDPSKPPLRKARLVEVPPPSDQETQVFFEQRKAEAEEHPPRQQPSAAAVAEDAEERVPLLVDDADVFLPSPSNPGEEEKEEKPPLKGPFAGSFPRHDPSELIPLIPRPHSMSRSFENTKLRVDSLQSNVQSQLEDAIHRFGSEMASLLEQPLLNNSAASNHDNNNDATPPSSPENRKPANDFLVNIPSEDPPNFDEFLPSEEPPIQEEPFRRSACRLHAESFDSPQSDQEVTEGVQPEFRSASAQTDATPKEDGQTNTTATPPPPPPPPCWEDALLEGLCDAEDQNLGDLAPDDNMVVRKLDDEVKVPSAPLPPLSVPRCADTGTASSTPSQGATAVSSTEADAAYLKQVYNSPTLLSDLMGFMKTGTAVKLLPSAEDPTTRIVLFRYASDRNALQIQEEIVPSEHIVSITLHSSDDDSCCTTSSALPPPSFALYLAGNSDTPSHRTIRIQPSSVADFEACILVLAHVTGLSPVWQRIATVAFDPIAAKHLSPKEAALCECEAIRPIDFATLKGRVLKERDDAICVQLFGRGANTNQPPKIRDDEACPLLLSSGELRYLANAMALDIFRVSKIWEMLRDQDIIYDPRYKPILAPKPKLAIAPPASAMTPEARAVPHATEPGKPSVAAAKKELKGPAEPKKTQETIRLVLRVVKPSAPAAKEAQSTPQKKPAVRLRVRLV